MSERLKALEEAGVAIWLDDLSRERIETGNLADLVKNSSVVGVTTNPSIFAAALKDGERYDAQVRELAAAGTSLDETVFALTTTDVRNACDVLAETFRATGGLDGRVSIEVDPRLAADYQGTVAQARRLWAAVDRPNLFIKIPATPESLPAVADVLAEGISVNVTLLFGLEQYDQVMETYLTGLERARAAGQDLSRIYSVASLFVSRMDSEVDKRLEAVGTQEALSLRGKVAVANARLAFAAYVEKFASDRFAALRSAGAHPQRLLWASTGVKNPAYSDTLYVADLVAPNTVNTMPEKTLLAFADHGEVRGDAVTAHVTEAKTVVLELEGFGVDLDDVVTTLRREGVEKFVASWEQLLATVEAQLAEVAQ